MRNPTPSIEDRAPRPGRRLGAAGEPTLTDILAAEVIRLARLATSLHLAEQARLMGDHATAGRDANASGASGTSGAGDAALCRTSPSLSREPVA